MFRRRHTHTLLGLLLVSAVMVPRPAGALTNSAFVAFGETIPGAVSGPNIVGGRLFQFAGDGLRTQLVESAASLTAGDPLVV